MTDFSKVLEQAKNMQNKMKETQESIKKIEVEGVAGGGSIKICLNPNLGIWFELRDYDRSVGRFCD